VTFSDTKADMTPDVLPDLYRGEPLVLAARLGKLAGTMEVKGRIGDRPWSVTLPLANAAEGRGLSKLWARRKIADAEVAQTMRALTADEANKTILALALEHQLVTRLTSLVAVDKTVTRPAGEPLKVSELPLNLPAGWDFEKVFGERSKLVPSTAPIERRAEERDGRTRVAMRGASTMAPTVSQPQQGVVLPATATDAEWKMIVGAVLMAFALILAHRRRRVFG
jgi:Ca-activated chloride channel family protein